MVIILHIQTWIHKHFTKKLKFYCSCVHYTSSKSHQNNTITRSYEKSATQVSSYSSDLKITRWKLFTHICLWATALSEVWWWVSSCCRIVGSQPNLRSRRRKRPRAKLGTSLYIKSCWNQGFAFSDFMREIPILKKPLKY